MNKTDKLITITAGILSSISWFLCELRAPAMYGRFFVSLILVGIVLTYLFRKSNLPKFGWLEKLIVVLISLVSFVFIAGLNVLLWASILYCLLLLAVIYKKKFYFAQVFESIICGLIIIATLFVISEVIYKIVLWYVYDTTFFDRIISPVLSFLGAPNSLIKQGINIYDGRNTHLLHYGIERIHAIWASRFLLSYFICLYIFFGHKPNIRQFIIVTVRALFVCSVWVIGSFIVWNYSKQAHIFVSRPLFIFFDLVGIALVLPFASKEFKANPEGIQTRFGKISFDRLCVQLIACLLVIFCTWFPIGDKKQNNKILVDDYYSAWEVSDSPFKFTEESMTKKSAYSYTNFVDYIKYYYPVEINKKKTLDQYKLEDYSIILLKTNTRSFSSKEIKCLLEFVRNGGGLFIHGDHTNLFGMSDHYNKLLKYYKTTFNIDDEAAYDGNPNLYKRKIFHPVHPTMSNVRTFRFLTSCTLKTSNIFLEPVIVSQDIFSEDAIYGRPGFFGNMRLDGNDRVGCFLQAAIVPYGEGRVAIFSDSTVFSNFAAFQSDYIDYGIDTLEYLQHKNTNRRVFVLLVIAILVVIWIAYIIFASYKNKPTNYFRALSYDIGIGYVVGLLLSICLVPSNQLSAKPLQPIPRIAVVLGNATNTNVLSATYKSEQEKVTDFGSFILCLQRYGYFPTIQPTLTEALRVADHIVIINPDSKWNVQELRNAYHRVVSRKTHILVVDSIHNNGSTANEILNTFGINLAGRTIPSVAKRLTPLPDYGLENKNLLFTLLKTSYHLSKGGFAVAEINPPVVHDLAMLTLEGGEPVFVDLHKNVTCTKTMFRNSSIVMAYIDSANLSMQALGGGFMKHLTDDQINHIKSVEKLLMEFEK